MLLIIEALLLILAALGQDHRAASAEQIFPLNTAPYSVDDEYKGCRGKMASLLKTTFLKKEIDYSPEFKKAWQEGEKKATAQDTKLTRDHCIAIHVYTNLNSSVHSNFNMAVHSGKQLYLDKIFKWYSLHFLLTDAIQILNKTQNKCQSTYLGTNTEYYKNLTGKVVRFGSFISSSLVRKVAKGFGTTSCFEMYTCEGADVTEYSKFPEQKEVLIPPYEKFKIIAVKTRKNKKNLWCETVYKLKSSGRRGNLNCAAGFKRSTGYKCICSKRWCTMYATYL